MLSVDTETYLPGDLLVKMDIATMAHSLEGRSPFLDHVFMSFAARLPVRDKVHRGQRKIALRRAFRGVLPDDVLDRPKQGFSVPLAAWLRGPLQPLAREVLLDPRVELRGQFRRTAIARLLDDHAAGRADHAPALWLMLVLELWQQTVLDA
jgi:asparagine synthase (glutamine-hydrolysing)